MKAFLISTVALIALYVPVTAQGTYINAGFGYGLPSGDRVGINEGSNIEKNIYGSFGKGLTMGLNTGHMANENIGLDLGIWYVTGSSYKFTSFSGAGNSTHQVNGNTIRIMPAVKIAGGNTTKPYAKFGLLLGIATTLNDDETFTPQTGGDPVLIIHEWTGGTSFGWTGAFGIDLSESQKASIFIEVNFCYQLYKPDLETVTVAGQDAQKFRLVDEPNAAAADEKLKPSFPFSTIGLKAGVKFSSSVKKKNSGTEVN